MPYPQELESWIEELSIAFPKLNSRQAEVLSLYSYGMALTKHCGQTIVVVFLALLLYLKSQNLRQRLKEFTYEAGQKRGRKRCEVEVTQQFAPLLAWILQQWQDKKKVVLAVDVTYLKDRYMILCISVVYGQTTIPVAWKVLRVNTQGEWHPVWLTLLAHIAPALPKSTQVLLLFDRGLYSKRLFEAIRSYGWHPFMRIREQGLYKRLSSKHWHNLKHLAYRGMSAHAFRVQCFKGDPLQAYLWLAWDEQHHEPCLLLSDLAPKHIKGNPYPLRMWIEAGFKDCKRGGLHWEQSKIPDPARMERLLFVIAVALFYLIRLGNSVLSPAILASDPVRRLSMVTHGWLHLLVSTIHHSPFTTACFRPYDFPLFYPSQNTYP